MLKITYYIIGVVLFFIGTLTGLVVFNFFMEGEKTTSEINVPGEPYFSSEAQNLNNKLKNEAITKADEASIKRRLAEVSMRLDTNFAYSLLREVAEDTSYPNKERALAVSRMADIFLTKTSQLTNFATTYIFTGGAPYSSMISSNVQNTELPNEVWGGMLKLYEYSNSLSPSPIAEFRISEWYTQELENEGPTTDSLNLAIDHYTRGKDLFDNFISTTETEDRYLVGYVSWLKGLVESRLYTATKDVLYKNRARLSFEESRGFLQTEISTEDFAVNLIWTDLYFAKFLASLENPDNEQSTIVSLLDEIVRHHKPSYGFSRYLDRISRTSFLLPHQQNDRDNIKSLGTFNLNFETFLKQHSF